MIAVRRIVEPDPEGEGAGVDHGVQAGAVGHTYEIIQFVEFEPAADLGANRAGGIHPALRGPVVGVGGAVEDLAWRPVRHLVQVIHRLIMAVPDVCLILLIGGGEVTVVHVKDGVLGSRKVRLHPGGQGPGGAVEELDFVRKSRPSVGGGKQNVVPVVPGVGGEVGVGGERDQHGEFRQVSRDPGHIHRDRFSVRPFRRVPSFHDGGIIDGVDGDAAGGGSGADRTRSAGAGAAEVDLDVVEVDVLGGADEALHDAEPHPHIIRQRGEVLEGVALAARDVPEDFHAFQQCPVATTVVRHFKRNNIQSAFAKCVIVEGQGGGGRGGKVGRPGNALRGPVVPVIEVEFAALDEDISGPRCAVVVELDPVRRPRVAAVVVAV